VYEYLRDTTYGQIDVGDSEIKGWFTMAMTHAIKEGDERPSRAAIIQSCIAATAGTVDVTKYDRVLAFTNARLNEGNDGQNRVLASTADWSMNVAFMSHEMLHCYGQRPHANDTSPRVVQDWAGPGVYWDPYDVMGITGGPTRHIQTKLISSVSPDNSIGGPELNGRYKSDGGYLPFQRVALHEIDTQAQSFKIRLAALNRPEVDAPLLARVSQRLPSGDVKHLAIELRQPVGWDRAIDAPMVLLREVRWEDLDGKSYWVTYLQTNPVTMAGGAWPAWPGDAAAWVQYFVAGESVIWNYLRVTVLSIDPVRGIAEVEISVAVA
jgi:hypothetical protein